MAKKEFETTAEIKAWLLKLRTDRDLSQADVAARANVSAKSVQNWEGAGGLPRGAEFLRYLRALDVKITPAPPVKVGKSVNDKLDEVLEHVKRGRAKNNAIAAGARPEVAALLRELEETQDRAAELMNELFELAAMPEASRFLRTRHANGRRDNAGAPEPQTGRAGRG